MSYDEPTQRIVDWVQHARTMSVPKEWRHAAIRNYVDAVGCAAAGFAGESSVIIRKLASTNTGSPAASAFGIATPCFVDAASFSNSAATRYLDWNDGGLEAHASDTSSAVFALAESNGNSGLELVTAFIVAYEVVRSFSLTVPLRDMKWDQGLLISLGVAAGGSYLLGLTPEQTANAVAIAVTPGIPLRVSRAGKLSHWKALASAHAAFTATTAVRLAQGGITGPGRPFDGTEGVFEKITGPFKIGVIAPPPGHACSAQLVHHKAYPSFMESQGPISLMLSLRDENIAAGDIESIKLTTFHLSWHEGGGGQGDHAAKWDPQTRETADHSLPYCMARALVSGPITPDSFTSEMVLDPALRPLMQKIVVEESPEFSKLRATNHEENDLLEVKLTNGTEIKRHSKFHHGHVEDPLSDDELSGKFTYGAQKVLPGKAVQKLGDLLWRLDEQKSLEKVASLYRQFETRA